MPLSQNSLLSRLFSDDSEEAAKGAAHRWHLVILFAAVVGVYLPTLGYDFVEYDDAINIIRNPLYNPFTLAHLWRVWHGPVYLQYMPVTWSFWGLCARLGATSVTIPRVAGTPSQIDAFPFHLFALLLHLANAFLVYALLRRIVQKSLPALFGALLFALHPLQVECVAWVDGSNISLAYFFGLAALNLSLRAKRSGWTLLGATLLFACAMLSKPTAVSVLLAALVIDIGVFQRPLRSVLPPMVLWAGIALAVIVYNWLGSKISQTVDVPLWQRLFVAGDACAFYLGKFLWPQRLCLDYSRSPNVVLYHGWAYLTWIAPFAVILLIVRLRRPLLTVALLLSLVALLPVSGLVPFYFQRQSTVADRYVYFALLGPALALAWALTTRIGQRPAVRLTVAGLIALLAVVSAVQVRVWRSNQALFENLVQSNPKSGVGHYMLGNVYTDLGRKPDAADQYDAGIKVAPDWMGADFYTSWGETADANGRPSQAERFYQNAILLQPNNPDVLNALGYFYARHGALARAAGYWKRSLTVRPGSADTEYNLARALFQLGRYAESAEHARTLLRRKPGFAPGEALCKAAEAEAAKEAGHK